MTIANHYYKLSLSSRETIGGMHCCRTKCVHPDYCATVVSGIRSIRCLHGVSREPGGQREGQEAVRRGAYIRGILVLGGLPLGFFLVLQFCLAPLHLPLQYLSETVAICPFLYRCIVPCALHASGESLL